MFLYSVNDWILLCLCVCGDVGHRVYDECVDGALVLLEFYVVQGEAGTAVFKFGFVPAIAIEGYVYDFIVEEDWVFDW